MVVEFSPEVIQVRLMLRHAKGANTHHRGLEPTSAIGYEIDSHGSISMRLNALTMLGRTLAICGWRCPLDFSKSAELALFCGEGCSTGDCSTGGTGAVGVDSAAIVVSVLALVVRKE